MRRHYCTLRASAVTNVVVAHWVEALGLQDFGQRVTARLLARVWVAAAALRASLSAVAHEFRGVASHETLRSATRANLPADLATLEQRLQAGLTAWVPRALRRRRWPMAIDLTKLPFYGDRKAPGLYAGQSHAGTKYFWAVATCVVVQQGRRCTLGMVHVADNRGLPEVIQRLVEQAANVGVKPRYLLLDRGFYSAAVVARLEQLRLGFAIPMIRRGKASSPHGPTGTQRFFSRRTSGWYTYTWSARKNQGPTVRVRVAVVARPKAKPWVFISDRMPLRPKEIAQAYRRRFGIESSYRQLRQCLARSTTRDVRWKLLQIGLALMLRNVWVWLHAECLAAERGEQAAPALHRLRFALLLRWLADLHDQRIDPQRALRAASPLPTIP